MKDYLIATAMTLGSFIAGYLFAWLVIANA